MTYLIALIIAIALGAVIALLSFINFGTSFTDQSAAVKAQEFVQIGTQLDLAMNSYKAVNSSSSFVFTGSGLSVDFQQTVNNLGDWLKSRPSLSFNGIIGLKRGTTNPNSIYLISFGGGLSFDICDEIVTLSGQPVPSNLNLAINMDQATDSLSPLKFTCGLTNFGQRVAIFRVE